MLTSFALCFVTGHTFALSWQEVVSRSSGAVVHLEGQVLEVQDEEELAKLIEKDFKRAVRVRQNEPSLRVVI